VRLSKDEIMTYNEYSKMMARRKRAKDAYWNTVLKTLYPVSVLEDAGFKLLQQVKGGEGSTTIRINGRYYLLRPMKRQSWSW